MVKDDTLPLYRVPLLRRITELINEKGESFSIRSFASKIGINRETLRLMITGERHIPPSALEKIANGLGVTLERLKQLDTHSKELELAAILKSSKRSKTMLSYALEIARELVECSRGASERGHNLNTLGRVLFLQQQYDDAHKIWLEALDYAKIIQEQFDDKYLIHLITSNLMLTYTIRKEFSNIDEMLCMVEEAFPDDQEILGMTYFSRMVMQKERGNLELARKHAFRSLEHFERNNDNNQIGRALINLAICEYLLGNYKTSARALSSGISKVKDIEDTLVFAVKEYVKTLMKLRDYETASAVIDEYSAIVKEYPEYWAKLQIMNTVLQDDPSFADRVSNDPNMNPYLRYLACKCLMEYYFLKRDSESAMRYYEMSRIYSSTKSEFLDEEGF